MDHNALIQAAQKKDSRALGKLISLVENQPWEALSMIKAVYAAPGKAEIIGITGAPGAGKSTFLNAYIHQLRSEGKSVAVLAVDPVSPFTGGAILGDRIRWAAHFQDPGVFIRSLSTRGKLGGLSLATRHAADLLSAFQFDYILIETVGVGQSEVDIRKVADLTIMLLVPEWGDSVQALKAGILEIGDLFVINKADREGADRVFNEIQEIQRMSEKSPQVFKTSMNQPESFKAVFVGIEAFYQSQSALIESRRKERSLLTVIEWLEARLVEEAKKTLAEKKLGLDNPYEYLSQLHKKYPPGSLLKL